MVIDVLLPAISRRVEPAGGGYVNLVDQDHDDEDEPDDEDHDDGHDLEVHDGEGEQDHHDGEESDPVAPTEES